MLCDDLCRRLVTLSPTTIDFVLLTLALARVGASLFPTMRVKQQIADSTANEPSPSTDYRETFQILVDAPTKSEIETTISTLSERRVRSYVAEIGVAR